MILLALYYSFTLGVMLSRKEISVIRFLSEILIVSIITALIDGYFILKLKG